MDDENNEDRPSPDDGRRRPEEDRGRRDDDRRRRDVDDDRRRRDDDDDRDRRPRRRRRGGGDSSVPCPKCGSRSLRDGPWPWYLGTVGAIVCRAMICNDCDHEFDLKKPHANLATRKRNLAIAINGIGLLGIIAVLGGLALWLMHVMK
jgi:hypothetical protein